MPSSARDASLLPPRSPLLTPGSAAGPCSTPNAQQLYLRRQASLCSGIEDAPASEDFFSVPPTARSFFLERSSAAASTPANHSALGRGFADTTAAAANAKKSRRVAKRSITSPESRYSRALDEAASRSSSKPFSESFNSGSAPLSWTDASPLTEKTLSEEQQLSHTSAVTGKQAASHGTNNGGSRKGRRLRKRRHSRGNFLLDLNPPPQAALEMAAAATSKANPSPSSASAADAMETPPLPSVTSNTVALVDNHGTEAAFVSSSTASKTSMRKSGADDDPVAARGVRLTQAYTETLPLASDAADAGGSGGNTAALPTSPSGSMSSFSTVASSYQRDVLVRASWRGSSEVPRQLQRPESDTAPCRRRHSSRGAGGGASKLRSKEASATFSDSVAHGGPASHAPAAKATRGAGAAAGAEATSASSVVPLTTNPKPWVPSGRSAAATAVRADPRSTAHVMTTAATTTGPPGDTSRRSSLTHGSSPPEKSGGARPASATTAATGRRSLGGAAKPGSGKGAPRRTSTSGSLVPPSPTDARKPTVKRTAAAAALAATAAAADREPSDAEKAESVVEYAIDIGDTGESEGSGMDAVHIGGGSSDNGLQTALGATSPQPPLPQQHADRTEDAVKFNDINDGFPGQERVPQPCGSSADGADEPRLAGFQASPDVSNATVITSLADSAFLQSYTESQLVTIFGGSAAALRGCDNDYQHLWVSDEGRGGDGAAQDGDDSEGDRAALPADMAVVVAHRAVSSTDSDGQGSYSVSATSAEEAMLAATPSSAARSNAGSPTAKDRDALTLPKEDAVPPALAVSNGGNRCEEATECSPVNMSRRSFSPGSDSHASEVQVTTPR